MTMTQFFPFRAASVVLPGLLMLVLPALVQAQALTPPATPAWRMVSIGIGIASLLVRR